MSLESWFLIFLALFLLFPLHATAAVPDQLDSIGSDIVEEAEITEETEVPPETDDSTDDSIDQEEPSDPIDGVDPSDDPAEPSTLPVPTVPVYLPIIEDSTSAIVHAVLYGSFLICGTLVGIFLLRGRYGT